MKKQESVSKNDLIFLRGAGKSEDNEPAGIESPPFPDELQSSRTAMEMQSGLSGETPWRSEVRLICHDTLYDFAPTGFVTLDAKGVIREINLPAADMLGRDRSLLLNTPFISHIIKSDRKKILCHLASCKQTDDKVMSTMSISMERGNFFHLQLISIAVRESLQNEPLILTALVDVSEIAEVRHLAEEMRCMEERDRCSIAAELRNNILGFVAMAKSRLDQLAGSIETPEQSAEIALVRESLDTATGKIESLARQICPTDVYETDLESALCSLVTMAREEYNIPAEFRCEAAACAVDEKIQAIIFQVVRELIMDAAKHAQAKRIVISLSIKRGNILVQVEDNGMGFDPDQIFKVKGNTAGIGLLNARLRLEHIGGDVQIDTAPGCGTCIMLKAPLKERVY